MPVSATLAQEVMPDSVTTMKARVLEVIDEQVKEIPGTNTKSTYQTVRVVILDGEERGMEVTVENDYLKLKQGEVFYLVHTVGAFDGSNYYSVSEPYRMPVIYFFIALFILVVLVFGGIQGLRGLLALLGSFLFIFYLLFPGILGGYSPIAVSIVVSSLIVVLGSYVTHGFNKTTTTAVVGMIVTILFTGALAYAAVHFGRLSGFESDEAVYLNFDTGGVIDFSGLLLGGILIGLLGVLYDAAIGQSIAVEELHRVAPHLPRRIIFARAVRIGREHIGALVNTLAIAYVGASLPLLLLFYSSATQWSVLVNREIFAAEIMRTMIGSIGLVLAVPITTVIAVWVLVKKKEGENQEVVEKELETIDHMSHSHHH